MASNPPNKNHRPTFTDQEALLFHSHPRPGKLEVVATKPMATQRPLNPARPVPRGDSELYKIVLL